jgi:hypothetical protein
VDVKVDFLAVPTLSVPALVGVNFISNHVTAILPPQRLIVFGTKTVPIFEKSDPDQSAKDNHCRVVRSSQDYLVPPMCEMIVGAVTKREGLSTIRPCWRKTSDRVFAPNGILELPLRGEEFLLTVGNLSTKPRFVRKGQVIAVSESLGKVLTVKEELDVSC